MQSNAQDLQNEVLTRMLTGGEGERLEVERISAELRTRELANGGQKESLVAGVYGTEYTTSLGTFGVGAVVIKGTTFVGADGLQFCRGDIQRDGIAITALMEVTRHNFSVDSVFGSDALFTLNWVGTVTSVSGFTLKCTAPRSDVVVRVTGVLLLAH